MSECRHTKQPTGYLDWHAWAEEMAKTHEQSKCPTCGLWAIWTKRTAVTPRSGTKGTP